MLLIPVSRALVSPSSEVQMMSKCITLAHTTICVNALLCETAVMFKLLVHLQEEVGCRGKETQIAAGAEWCACEWEQDCEASSRQT